MAVKTETETETERQRQTETETETERQREITDPTLAHDADVRRVRSTLGAVDDAFRQLVVGAASGHPTEQLAPVIGVNCTTSLHTAYFSQRRSYIGIEIAPSPTRPRRGTALNERAPEYLITDCCWADNHRSGTRNAGCHMLEVLRMNTSFGDRSFAAAAPHVWNSLSDAVRNSALSEDALAKLLKTYLMNCM